MKRSHALRLGLTSIIVALAVSFQVSHSQVNESWVAQYDGALSADDIPTAITVDDEGNVYVTGRSASENYFDYATIKYNPDGNQLWVSLYDGPGNYEDMTSSIYVDGDGYVYVTGWSAAADSSTDYATIKYDADGAQIWVSRYNGPGDDWDEAFDLAVDAAGNIYVTGASVRASGYSDITTIKYSSSGAEEWVARYSPSEDIESESRQLAIDEAGNIYVTGWTNLVNDMTGESFNYVTIKYDATGSEEWVAVYDGPAGGADRAYALGLDQNGNVYVTGLSEAVASSLDYATVKYDPSGAELWVERYIGPDDVDRLDVALDLEVDNNGAVVVTGLSQGEGTSWDFATVKYSSAGDELWVSRYDGPSSGEDQAFSIKIGTVGDVYVCGLSWSGTEWTSSDYATVKYNADGEEQWVVRYDGPDTLWDEGSSMALDLQGNVYVTGSSYGDTVTNEDYATIKYSQISDACAYIPGDCDYDGTPLALADVIAMISLYRGDIIPVYECDCPPNAINFTPTADPNGNCIPNELPDVVWEISAYRGNVTAYGCADCPGAGPPPPLLEQEGTSVIPSLKSKMKIGKRSISE